MFWLIFGLIIWADVHLFRRVAPSARSSVMNSVGEGPYKGIVALLLVISIVMMSIGFRQMDANPIYTPPPWLGTIGFAFNIFAVILMGAANSKSRLRGLLRHPMLTGIIVWSAGHLMNTGSLRDLILFGGMIIWAVAEIRLINQQEPNHTPYKEGTLKGDLILIAAGLLLSAVIFGIHIWIWRS